MAAVNRSCVGSIFIFFTVALNVEGWRPFRVTLKSLAWQSSNVAKINASLSQSGAISVHLDILDNVNHLEIQTEIFVNSGSDQYDFEIMNRTINVCEFFRNKNYEPLLQLFYKMLLETGPWPTACPIRKSRLSLENFIVDPDKLPPYLPERKGYIRLEFQNKENGIVKDYNMFNIFFELENIRFKHLLKKKH